MSNEITWETYDGETNGYSEAGADVISISARTRYSKWGDVDSNVRTWFVTDDDGRFIAKGKADGLRAAKKAALAALAQATS